MPSTPRRIMELAESLPEATPLCPSALLGFGTRAAVDQALSRLVGSRRLLRICRGVYMRLIQTQFGLRAPGLHMAVAALAELWGETIVVAGGSAANWLRLTTQNPVRAVYLTSGPSRRLQIGSLVELRHAPDWQLVAPHSKAGTLVRALTYVPRDGAEAALDQVLPTFSAEERSELATARIFLPNWMAEAVASRLAHA